MIINRYSGLTLLILFLGACVGIDRGREVLPENTRRDPPPETSSDLREYAIPEGLEFIPIPFLWPTVAPGVGVVTRGQKDPGTMLGGEARLTESFRAAYIDGLLRELPLTGTLGGDFVHGWPSSASLCWVQNWQIRDTSPGNRGSASPGGANSWGVPSLVLAIQGIDRDQTFIVQGAILNAYGKSAGLNSANGVMGYGAPRGDEFMYQGDIAQQFDYGLIHVDAAGKSVFIPNPPPELPAPVSAGKLPAEEIPHDLGYFPDGDESLRIAFRLAWQRGISRNLPPLIPDGPVQRIVFPKNLWRLETDRGDIRIKELYYQTLNGGSVLFLLGVSPDAALQTRILAAPFINALLANSEDPIPGTDTSGAPLPEVESPGGFADILLRGLGFYGLPLTDAFPRWEANSFRETQRFSLGWMVGP